jgi:ribosomal 50S subunit-associated protein YjgA (DUF615 family)
MPILPAPAPHVVTAAAVGFTTGALAAVAVFARLDRNRRRHLQAVLQYRADALADALDALATDGETDYHMMHTLEGLRDQAVGLADAVKGAGCR